MRTAFILIVASVGILLAWVYPLVAVARGRPLGRTVLITWGLLVGYLVAISFLLPGIIGLFSKEAGREVADHWVPEGTGVAAMMCVGWLWPLIFGSIGRLLQGPSTNDY